MSYNKNNFREKKGDGKKGFYLSICTALICLMAVGTVYYRTNYPTADNDSSNKLANEVTQQPATTPTGGGSIAQEDFQADGPEEGATEETQEASTIMNGQQSEKEKKSQDLEKLDEEKKKSSKKQKDSVATMSGSNEFAFQEEKGLLWPVQGEVILKYSKSNTIYFKTLAQYKCNPAIAIQAKEGKDVAAAATGTVTNISKSEENGTIVTTSIGNGYTVTYGQLKNVKVTKGQTIQEGDVIGKVAAPTKYFTEEGSHLYLQVMQNKETVDPLLLLR